MSTINPLIQLKLAKFLLPKQDHITLYNYRDLITKYNQQEKFLDLSEKIAQGYPLDYIFGEVNFLDKIFKIDGGVLIPREETEWWVGELEKLILDKQSVFSSFIGEVNLQKIPILVDLGAGSGVIGLSLAKYFTQTLLMDNSVSSINLINRNIDALSIKKALAVHSNWLQNTPYNVLNNQDWVLLSNPPYVPIADQLTAKEMRIEYEPKTAIFSGQDGLSDFKIIVDQLSHNIQNKVCNVPKLAIFELDPRNIHKAMRLIQDNLPGMECRIYKDLNVLDRLLVCKRLTMVN